MFMEQLSHVINSLKSDKYSRQAVINLWRNNPQEAKDKPCTLSFHFMIRQGQLNLHATMRSNDVIWGQNYDVPSFSLLNIVLAGILKVRPGKLFLTANSLHIYEKHFELAEELIKENYSFNEDYELPICKVDSLEHHMECVEECLRAHYLVQSQEFFDYKLYFKLKALVCIKAFLA
jgi:thymidylate synthase